MALLCLLPFAALAQVVQRETDLQSARRRLPRTEQLARDGFLSDQVLEDEHAKLRNLEAALAAEKAEVKRLRACKRQGLTPENCPALDLAEGV